MQFSVLDVERSYKKQMLVLFGGSFWNWQVSLDDSTEIREG